MVGGITRPRAGNLCAARPPAMSTWGMASVVTRKDVADGIRRLSLSRKVVELHVSLRSFPRLDGGPEALVDAFLDAQCTLLVPTMAPELFAIPAPVNDRPARNGLDYAAEDRESGSRPGTTRAVYDASRTETASWLGATPAYVAARPDRIRSRFPVGELSALGPRAVDLMNADTPEDAFGPLRALVALDGAALLIGVSLTRLTLLHLAETEAGRRPFIRWALDPDGIPTRIRAGECSEGFDRLAPALQPVETQTTVGTSLWRAFPAVEVVKRAAAAIRVEPNITHCPNTQCIECADAIAGGPVE
jgi:aminoglycoside N3'-acetyltransferase